MKGLKLIGYDSDSCDFVTPVKKIGLGEKKRNFLYAKYDKVCQLCQRKVEYKDISCDHIIPRSKGGSNAKSNLQLTHTWCNTIKGDSLEDHPPEYYWKHPIYGGKL